MKRSESTGTAQPEFWQEAPEYHGVLAAAGAWRLAVSPNGKRYLLQERGLDGTFVVRRWRKQLSKLRHDLPDGLAGTAVLETLPEWPGDVARPWADAMTAAGDRVRRALVASDSYAGVIAAADGVRLAIAPNGQKYLLQERDGERWLNVVATAKAATVFDLVFSWLAPDHKAAAFSRKPALMSAAAELPARATEYRGRRVERLEDAVGAVAAGRPRGSAIAALQRQASGTSG